MIYNNLKCIYIHIPKTGGMSIESILGSNLKNIHQRPLSIKHGYPSEWKYPKYWKKYYKFTFVRNPWDRAVSAYYFNLKIYSSIYLLFNLINLNTYPVLSERQYYIMLN